MLTRNNEGEVAGRLPGSDRLVSLLLPAFVMTLAIWLSTGTLAPYAATLDHPVPLEPCQYLANTDHFHYVATFAMLDGHSPSEWEWSVVLPRVLYPIVAFPLMKVAAIITGDPESGFLLGGVLTTILIHLAALLIFVKFVRLRYGRVAAIAAAWLLATFPGITYWAGLPYCYALIVPVSLLAIVLLTRIDEDEGLRLLIGHSLLLGLLFTGYDLLAFFGTASILLTLRRRNLLWSVVNAGCFLLPVVAVGALFRLLPSVSVTSNADAIYGTILFAFLDPKFEEWGRLLLDLPGVAVSNFLFGSFVFLPVAWLLSLLLPDRGERRLQRVEAAILLAVATVFLVNNAAPPYSGFQYRGVWQARFYMPIFAVLALGLARWCRTDRWKKATIAGIVLLNATIAFGPVCMNPVAMNLYARFYRHASPGAMHRNLVLFGRRPLGFCSERVKVDVVEPARAPLPRYIWVP